MSKLKIFRNKVNGERQISASADGYDPAEWELEEDNVDEPPPGRSERKGKKWERPANHADEERRARLRAMDDIDRFDFLERRIKELEGRVASLESGNG